MFHADTDMGIRQESTIERNDILALAIVHDLELPQDLLTDRRLRIDEDQLRTQTNKELSQTNNVNRPSPSLP
jgi:hypothetical protein